jgi:hypothetical protein
MGLRSLGSTGLVAIVAAGAPVDAAPRGKVVAIERPRDNAVPRICGIQSTTVAFCMGAPQPGERIVLVDQQSGTLLGELRVEGSLQATDWGLCTSEAPGPYRVTAKLVAGDARRINTAGAVMGLRGVRVDPRTRVLREQKSPSGVDGETVELALDLDEDGSPDVLVTQYGCNESGVFAHDGNRICIDTYMRRGGPSGSGGRLDRIRREALQRCF